MDFIVTCTSGMEVGFLRGYKSIDLVLGGTEDFAIEMADDVFRATDYRIGYMFFCPGTDVGGILERVDTSTKTNVCTWKGWTWRGILAQKVIKPDSGADYKVVSGDVNAVMAEIIGTSCGSLISASSETSGFTVTNYQFDRYCTMLAGFEKMLKSVGAKLQIRVQEGAAGQPVSVKISTVAVADYSESVELSQDNKLDFSTQNNAMGVNHLICLGKGDLAARTVVHLYVQSDGTIGTTRYYTGLSEREAIYDYSSADDASVLTSKGREQLASLRSYKKIEMSIYDLTADLGDIVGGRDRITGMTLAQPVTQKIIKVDASGSANTDYKVGG